MQWYTKQGEPMHWVDKADGSGTRDTNLSDARKLDLLPSVTGIEDILDKPGLNAWGKRMIIEACYDEVERSLDESLQEYGKRINELAFGSVGEARDIGGEIHKDIEHIFNDDMPEYGLKHHDISVAAYDIIVEYCGTDQFICEKTVAGKGYGGAIDIHNDDILGDHKSKDITDKQWGAYQGAGKDPKIAYPNHARQLAAYDQALGGGPRRCINFFIDRKIPGRVIVHEWEATEIIHAYAEFRCLVTFWQLSKKYWPEQ